MGAEAVAIFAIFTGQAWNIMLTLYQIMEVIPSRSSQCDRSVQVQCLGKILAA